MRFYVVLFVTAMSIVLCGFNMVDNSNNIEEINRVSEIHFSKKEYDLALPLNKRILELSNDKMTQAVANKNLSLIYLHKYDYSNSSKYLNNLCKNYDDELCGMKKQLQYYVLTAKNYNTKSVNDLGKILYELGGFANVSIDIYDKFGKNNFNYLSKFYYGQANYALGHKKSGIKYLESSVKEKAEKENTYVLGRMYVDADNRYGAMAQHSELVKIDKRIAEQLSSEIKKIKINSTDPNFYMSEARKYYKNNNFVYSIYAYKDAIGFSTINPMVQYDDINYAQNIKYLNSVAYYEISLPLRALGENEDALKLMNFSCDNGYDKACIEVRQVKSRYIKGIMNNIRN